MSNWNKTPIENAVHAIGHGINANLKENGYPGIETTGVYRAISPNKGKGQSWSSEVDRKRVEHHWNQFDQKCAEIKNTLDELQEGTDDWP